MISSSIRAPEPCRTQHPMHQAGKNWRPVQWVKRRPATAVARRDGLTDHSYLELVQVTSVHFPLGRGGGLGGLTPPSPSHSTTPAYHHALCGENAAQPRLLIHPTA